MKIDIDLSDVEVDEETEWVSLPDGDYRGMITDSNYKETANGLGKCLHLRFSILEGEHRNRQVMDYLTLEHSTSETAVKIAKERLKSLAVAVGIKEGFVSDSELLHNKPLTLTVSRERDDDYGDANGYKNRVKKYRSDGSIKDSGERESERAMRVSASNSSAPEEDAWA